MHSLQFNVQALEIGCGRTQGTHNARKHEKIENYSLASMSTTAFIVFYKTKNVSQLLGKKGPLLDMYLMGTISCLLEALTLRKSFANTKNVSPQLGKKGPSLGTY